MARSVLAKTGRTRGQGWKRAKIEGHNNEGDIARFIEDSPAFAVQIAHRCFGHSPGIPTSVIGEGASGGRVKSVFGSKTTGKPDITIKWGSGIEVRPSVKMSKQGQAFLTSVDRFASGFKLHYGRTLPRDVRFGLDLFIGGDRRLVKRAMAGKTFLGPLHKSGELLELHQGRLVAVTLDSYFNSEWQATIDWFAENIGKIADFTFARGFARNKSDFATHIWYSPLKKAPDLRFFAPISHIVDISEKNSSEVRSGTKNGGSTLSLPFGKLQMHAPSGSNEMQLRHDRAKIFR